MSDVRGLDEVPFVDVDLIYEGFDFCYACTETKEGTFFRLKVPVDIALEEGTKHKLLVYPICGDCVKRLFGRGVSAKEWAKAWMKALEENPKIPYDEEIMEDWFKAVKAGREPVSGGGGNAPEESKD